MHLQSPMHVSFPVMVFLGDVADDAGIFKDFKNALTFSEVLPAVLKCN